VRAPRAVAVGRPAVGAGGLKRGPTDVPGPTNVGPGVDPGVAPAAVTGVDPGVAITVTGSGGPLSRSHQPASTPAANTAASTGRMRARWLSFGFIGTVRAYPASRARRGALRPNSSAARSRAT